MQPHFFIEAGRGYSFQWASRESKALADPGLLFLSPLWDRTLPAAQVRTGFSLPRLLLFPSGVTGFARAAMC